MQGRRVTYSTAVFPRRRLEKKRKLARPLGDIDQGVAGESQLKNTIRIHIWRAGSGSEGRGRPGTRMKGATTASVRNEKADRQAVMNSKRGKKSSTKNAGNTMGRPLTGRGQIKPTPKQALPRETAGTCLKTRGRWMRGTRGVIGKNAAKIRQVPAVRGVWRGVKTSRSARGQKWRRVKLMRAAQQSEECT